MKGKKKREGKTKKKVEKRMNNAEEEFRKNDRKFE